MGFSGHEKGSPDFRLAIVVESPTEGQWGRGTIQRHDEDAELLNSRVCVPEHGR